MELLQLRYFQKVAELENVSKAARYFSIPQPSLSQAIARLERDLGVNLFDRKNGKVRLNEKGKVFLIHVQQMLLELDQGVAAVSDDQENITGPVSIKIMENHRFILTCIPKFSALYPDVTICVSHGYYEDQDADYDLCISSRPAYNRMNSHAPLIKERIALAVHEDHPLAHRESVGIPDLRGQKLISLPAQSELYSQTVKLCRENGFEPTIPIICDDPYFIRKYVSENMGVALAPVISWKGRFRPNTVLIPVETPEVYLTSYLVWDGTRYISPAVNKFREFLLDEAKVFSEDSSQ